MLNSFQFCYKCIFQVIIIITVYTLLHMDFTMLRIIASSLSTNKEPVASYVRHFDNAFHYPSPLILTITL